MAASGEHVEIWNLHKVRTELQNGTATLEHLPAHENISYVKPKCPRNSTEKHRLVPKLIHSSTVHDDQVGMIQMSISGWMNGLKLT